MSIAPKSGDAGEGGEMDIDLGEVINLESGQEGAAGGDGSAVEPTITEMLEQSFQDLVLEADGTKRMELISKFEASRAQTAEEERRARRAAWTEETRKVILERQLFQESGTTDVFPELVWEQILKKVDDPRDKARLARMSQVWRDLSKKGRTTFLFDEVIGLIHARGLLSRDDILHCRAVSGGWKSSTENRLQKFDEFPRNPRRSYLELVDIKPWIYTDKVPISFSVRSLGRGAAFLTWSQLQYTAAGRNPFFSRALALGCICPHDVQTNLSFWVEMNNLLTQWGHEIWSLLVQFPSPNHLDSVGAYEQIVNLMRLLPNLKQLWLMSPEPFIDAPGYTERLLMFMRENPLPEMPHLRSIMSSHLSSLITQWMLEKFGPTLDTFMAFRVNGGDICENAQLPKLKHMSLLYTQVSPITMNWPSVDDFDLHYRNSVPADIPNIFRNLAAVGTTLRKLNLFLLKNEYVYPTKLDAAAIKMLTLDLPNLEEFALSMRMGPGNLKTIDFILPMTKLKILSLTYAKRVPVEVWAAAREMKTKLEKRKSGSSRQKKEVSGGEIINYWEYMNRLYESNIWLLFPELRKVTIVTLVEVGFSYHPPRIINSVVNKDDWKEKVYSREGFDEYSAGHGH